MTQLTLIILILIFWYLGNESLEDISIYHVSYKTSATVKPFLIILTILKDKSKIMMELNI